MKYTDLIKYTKRNGDCLFWSRGKTGGGYGICYRKRNDKGIFIQERVHRVSWELFNNKQIPKGMYVCHSCDNKLCIKGKHLWIGTPSDNTQDAYNKKRKVAGFGVGKEHWNAKLNRSLVTKIRDLYKTGKWTQTALGSRFKIDQASVSYIINNKIWNYA